MALDVCACYARARARARARACACCFVAVCVCVCVLFCGRVRVRVCVWRCVLPACGAVCAACVLLPRRDVSARTLSVLADLLCACVRDEVTLGSLGVEDCKEGSRRTEQHHMRVEACIPTPRLCAGGTTQGRGQERTERVYRLSGVRERAMT
jgi:hypothetical protein